MKQVRRCYRCGQVFPLRLCYQVEWKDMVPSMMTAEFNQQMVSGHICAACNADIGFVTNAEKETRARTVRNLMAPDINSSNAPDAQVS